MNKLDAFNENQIDVNWNTILIGWKGIEKFPSQLTAKEIIGYATDLVSNDDSQSELVWQLAGASESDIDEINNILGQLAQSENVDEEFEMRKWRVILAKDVLKKLSNEPLYGLIELTEFWEKFNYPNNSPHIVQGVNNSLTPQQYYTQENFNLIIQRHKEWIEDEIKSLVRNNAN